MRKNVEIKNTNHDRYLTNLKQRQVFLSIIRNVIDENIYLALQEFFAIIFDFLWHSGAEHHNLLMMGSFDEYILDIGSHFRGS